MSFSRLSLGSFRVLRRLMVGKTLSQSLKEYGHSKTLCRRSSVPPHLEQVSVSISPNLCNFALV